MTLHPRFRILLGAAAVIEIGLLAYQYWPGNSSPAVAASAGSVSMAEQRLARLREIAATVPAKEDIAAKESAELAGREKGLLTADTAAQAQAQLIQIVRRLGANENPPIEIRSTELGQIRPFGDAYGEVSVAVQIECRMDQLINVVTALPAQPELVATSDMRINSSNVKEKTVGVHLTISGVVPRKLVPEKKGAPSF